jgi:predicted dehydrogenase
LKQTGWRQDEKCSGFELTGAKGSLVYTHLNELLLCRADGDPRHNGYTRIEAGLQHHPYGLFCVAPGHQLGFNDLKTIEVAEFLEAIAGGERHGPDFREAWEIQKIIDTAVRSSKLRTWQAIE